MHFTLYIFDIYNQVKKQDFKNFNIKSLQKTFKNISI